MSMEIDTGASVSIINEETFKTIRKGESNLELQDTTVKLKYTGDPIVVHGSILGPVEHKLMVKQQGYHWLSQQGRVQTCWGETGCRHTVLLCYESSSCTGGPFSYKNDTHTPCRGS